MQPDKKDMARLWDILDASRAIIQFIHGKKYEDFLGDRMLRSAVERNLEIIGEAAKSVSPDYCNAHSEIPWKAMITLRNVLAHEYGEIRYDRLWIICIEQLGILVQHLEDCGVENIPEGN